jgi:hypothetical protein
MNTEACILLFLPQCSIKIRECFQIQRLAILFRTVELSIKMFSPPGTNSAAEKVLLSVRTSNGLLAKGILKKMAFKNQ